MSSQFKVMGLAMVAAGALTAAMVSAHPESLRAPAWVAYAACCAFILAGCSSLARAYRRDRLALGVVCLMLAALTAIPAWIGFWPGARQCGGVAGGFAFMASGAACRTAFGAGAVVMGAMLVAALRQWLGKARS